MDRNAAFSCRDPMHGERICTSFDSIPVLPPGRRISWLEQLQFYQLSAMPGHGFRHVRRMSRKPVVSDQRQRHTCSGGEHRRTGFFSTARRSSAVLRREKFPGVEIVQFETSRMIVLAAT